MSPRRKPAPLSTERRAELKARAVANIDIIVQRMWTRVAVRGPDDCWEWQGATSSGYGALGALRQTFKAHRLAWQSVNGPIPDGLHVLHRCDNPPCCNPAHLFLGTNADNVADMVAKDRQHHQPDSHPRGAAHHNAKLSEALVGAMRADFAAGLTRRQVSVKHGVAYQQVVIVIARRAWKHVA